MACRLFGAKPLSEPILDYCKFDPWEQILMKIKQISYNKMSLKMMLNFDPYLGAATQKNMDKYSVVPL